MDVLHEGLARLGMDDPALAEKMDAYIRTLQAYNAKFNLVNTDGYDDIAVRHILDSLSGAAIIRTLLEKRIAVGVPRDEIVLADIGSGAGLPGIPLAAAFSGFPFVLVERMTKRADFLRHCAATLGLQNVSVEENQAERLAQRRFDIAAFRAFRPLEKKMTKVLLRILKDGGYLAAYKAKREKIIAEMDALPAVPGYEIVPLTVPFLTQCAADADERERNMVVISCPRQSASAVLSG